MNDIGLAILQGIVEGITEFLPISSTGHLILVENFVGSPGAFANKSFSNLFNIVIQGAAMLAVLAFFFKRLLPKPTGSLTEKYDLWIKAMIGFIPAAFIGFLLDDLIEAYFFNPTTIAIMLIIGGGVLLWVERKAKSPNDGWNVAEMTYITALMIGFIQCIAMMPGTSRSAATIVAGLLLGGSRIAAAEFSFFLAIPTIGAASAYKLLKVFKTGIGLNQNEILILSIGCIVSFVVAFLVIKILMQFISQRDFKSFAYYRIVLGIIVLSLVYSGYFQPTI